MTMSDASFSEATSTINCATSDGSNFWVVSLLLQILSKSLMNQGNIETFPSIGRVRIMVNMTTMKRKSIDSAPGKAVFPGWRRRSPG